MKKGFFLAFVLSGLLLVGVANAQTTVTWTMLESATVAGNSGGADKLVGTGDDGTDNCNFQPDINCQTAGSTPTIGSYSINVIDWKWPAECGSGLVGNSNPCVCNDDVTGCAPGPETCPPVSGPCGSQAGDCCKALDCIACVDSSSYFGSGTTYGNAGTLTVNQTSAGHAITAFDAATTESLPGEGGGCFQLGSGGTQPNGGATCGSAPGGTAMSGWIDVDTYIGGCVGAGGTLLPVPDIPYSGVQFPVGSPPAGGACGYSQAELVAIQNAAPGTANHIMVLCGQVTLADPIPVPCFGGAVVDFVVVAHTADNANSCP